ncbi:hypothetical protein ACO0LC_25160, partial [Undibacterium sp. JH2W]|uniref:hypothetical protein n=1 Tax=Undibacterium sp. JH2W TaxID=3413037 RepID=UPI003BF17482
FILNYFRLFTAPGFRGIAALKPKYYSLLRPLFSGRRTIANLRLALQVFREIIYWVLLGISDAGNGAHGASYCPLSITQLIYLSISFLYKEIFISKHMRLKYRIHQTTKSKTCLYK